MDVWNLLGEFFTVDIVFLITSLVTLFWIGIHIVASVVSPFCGLFFFFFFFCLFDSYDRSQQRTKEP